MAITKSLSTAVDLDLSTITTTDGSTYTSPSRTTCGVFVKIYKVDAEANTSALVTTPNDSDPGIASSWTADYASDGWYQDFYVAVPDWAVTSYDQYDAVYQPTTQIVYRSRVNSNSVTTEADLLNTTNWEVISEPTSLCLNVGTSIESDNLTVITSIATFNEILYSLTKQAFEEQTGIAFLEQASSYRRPQDVRLYNLLGVAYDGMIIADDNQEYVLGEVIARRAVSIIP